MATVQIIGLTEANAALLRLPTFAKAEFLPVAHDTAQQVVTLAQSKVPARTGLLKSQIAWEPTNDGAVVGIYDPAFYWKYLEYGTVKMGARPFMRPAADAVQDGLERNAITAFEEAADLVERSQ